MQREYVVSHEPTRRVVGGTMAGITFEHSSDLLTPVLERVFGEAATVAEYDIVALKPGAGNPTSLGVYRVSGTALVAGEPQSFSVVVKHLANGQPILDATSPLNWNYWRREMEFFESELVNLIPNSIGFPAYLGQSDLPDGSALFWNADLGDITKTKWTWADCLNAAELVAELNSAELKDHGQYEWLNTSQVQGWAELHDAWGSYDSTYPMLKKLADETEDGRATLALLEPYLDHRNGRIANILRSGRHSFVHGDFNLNNLVAVRDGDVTLIALDWQLCGVARLGTEVAAIFNTAIEHGVIGVEASKFVDICSVYARRFNELNPNVQVSVEEIELAAAAMGYFICVGMGFFFGMPDPQLTDKENWQKVQNMLDGFTNGVVRLYAEVLGRLS